MPTSKIFAPPPPQPPPPPPLALPVSAPTLYAAAVFHCVQCGAFYGFWQAASFVRAEGGLREACSPRAAPLSQGCAAQDAQFAALYTYASVLAFGVPLVSGLLLPLAGPRRTVLALTAVFAAGVAMLLAAAHAAPPGQLQSALVLPAFCCIAAASSANYLPLLSVASLFRRSSLALSVLSGSFDAGSGVFLIMRLAYEAGAPLRALLAAYLGAPVLLMLAAAALLWRDAPFQPPPSVGGEAAPPASPRAVLAALAAAGDLSAHGSAEGPHSAASAAAFAGAAPAVAVEAQPAVGGGKPRVEGAIDPASAVSVNAASANAITAAAAIAPSRCVFFPALDTARLHALPLQQQLATAEYAAFLAYFLALSLRFNYYLASLASQLGALGSAADVATYTNALGYLMPTLAIPAVLVAGLVLDARGPLAGLALLSALATLLSALQLVPSLPLQGFAALVFVLFRGTLFSCLSVFLSVLFGFGTLSALVGIVTAAAGVLSLATTPLIAWGAAGPLGFAAPNALVFALSAASMAFPAWMAVRGGHASLLHALAASPGLRGA